MEQIIKKFELTPEQRRGYYVRTLEMYQPGVKRKWTYSCNILCVLIYEDHKEQLRDDRRTSEAWVKDFLPEYHQVRREMSEINEKGVIRMPPWESDEQGDAKRREALAEAIKRVDLLIKS